MGKFPNTELQYLSDPSLLGNAEIIGIEETDYGSGIILDQTIFYPQGGGQPCDHGYLVVDTQKIAVISVRFDSGLVYHFTKETSTDVAVGAQVELHVDQGRRELNSKIHTGGHLIDTAMINCGYDFHRRGRLPVPDPGARQGRDADPRQPARDRRAGAPASPARANPAAAEAPRGRTRRRGFTKARSEAGQRVNRIAARGGNRVTGD